MSSTSGKATSRPWTTFARRSSPSTGRPEARLPAHTFRPCRDTFRGAARGRIVLPSCPHDPPVLRHFPQLRSLGGTCRTLVRGSAPFGYFSSICEEGSVADKPKTQNHEMWSAITPNDLGLKAGFWTEKE